MEFKTWLREKLLAGVLIVRLRINENGLEYVDLMAMGEVQALQEFGWAGIAPAVHMPNHVVTGNDFEGWYEEIQAGINDSWYWGNCFNQRDVSIFLSNPGVTKSELTISHLIALARAEGELREWLRRENDALDDMTSEADFMAVGTIISQLRGLIRSRARTIFGPVS